MPRRVVGKLAITGLILGCAAVAGLASAQGPSSQIEVLPARPYENGSAMTNNVLKVTRIVIHDGNGAEAVITDPVWAQTPSARDVAMAFPPIASVDSGTAKLRCTLTNQGTLTTCRTISQSPIDQGFSSAAQRKLISKFRLAIPDDPDVRLATLMVDIPFQFTRPGTPATVLTKVQWRSTPSYDQVAGALRQAGLPTSGARATLNCTVGVQGALSACRTRDESRPGVGAALVQVSNDFKVDLWSEDGRPTAGYRITVPMAVG